MSAEVIDALPAGFRFLRPLWLLGLLAIPLLLWWLRQRRLRHDLWRGAVDAHLLPHLLQGGLRESGGWRDRWPAMAMTLAAILATLALAGPSWRQLPQPLWQDRNPLVIALDLSYASLSNDVPPSRLLQARAKIAHILATRGGGQIATHLHVQGVSTLGSIECNDCDRAADFDGDSFLGHGDSCCRCGTTGLIRPALS